MLKVFLLFLVLSVTACTTTQNISPQPVVIPSSLSEVEAEFAILASLQGAPKPANFGSTNVAITITKMVLNGVFGVSNKYWFYEGRGTNYINAGFTYRNFYMRAEIYYTDKDITFKIVDSKNLKQSGDSIHKKALVWLSHLERDVRVNLGALDRVKYEQELLKNKS